MRKVVAGKAGGGEGCNVSYSFLSYSFGVKVIDISNR